MAIETSAPATDETIAVVICDDAPELRELTRLGIEQDSRLRVVGEAGSAEECFDLLGAENPDAVLLDLSLPGMDGLDAIPRLREFSPGLAIIVFSGFDAARLQPLAMEQGADDYVVKGKPLSDLRTALLAAAERHRARSEQAPDGLSSAPPPERPAQAVGEVPSELDQLLHAISHDLCEPLNLIRGFIDMLDQRHRETLDEDGRRYLAAALGGVERMQSQIDDLLALSRLGRATPALVEVDAADVVARVAAGLAAESQERATEVQIGALPIVVADQRMLTQLFDALLSNAIKFGPQGGNVTVSAEQGPSSWRFEIADEGDGIDPEHSATVFEVFQRLGGPEVPGTGVGLAMAARITEHLGGRLWHRPATGGGTVFSFTIPA